MSGVFKTPNLIVNQLSCSLCCFSMNNVFVLLSPKHSTLTLCNLQYKTVCRCVSGGSFFGDVLRENGGVNGECFRCKQSIGIRLEGGALKRLCCSKAEIREG